MPINITELIIFWLIVLFLAFDYISLFDDTKSFEELESIANNLKTFNSMKLAVKDLRKRLKDNKNTISDLIYKLSQAKLKIKQLTGE